MAEQNSGAENAGATDVVPMTVRVAGALVTLEGASGLVAMVALVVAGINGSAQNSGNSYLTAAYAAIVGGAVFAAGVGLLRGKRWGRAIAVLTQLLLLGVAYYMFTSDRPELGAPLALVTLAALVALFAPASTRWMAAGYDLSK
ncbi:Uncharacterised protein [Nocardia otitidiscaviarum]|uniref:Integral membrane protein n=1 Tax=Nocardia otitidiscaviarum TaxID=1823 RepID=A0A378Y6W5_9NOCA|nr:hypothetical protein [Nocardia otitidiscaviarum]SUA72955.1 Uncharacterised protein [Nocardia otitidiscaviarum]